MERLGPIFQSKEFQESFDKLGFVKMPLLSPSEANALKEVYKEVKEKHDLIDLPFVTTSHSNNGELIAEVNRKILNLVQDKILSEIKGCDILFSNFLVKRSGLNSESNPHQDLNIVDESKYLSFSVWIALDDNNAFNGAMRILPKSHLFDFSIRANSNSYWRYDNLHKEIKRDMISCPTKVGEALVFAHSTIHGSFPNLSKSDRLACVVSLYPREASLINYYLKEDSPSKMQQYAMTREAFINYVKGKEPEFGKLINEFNFAYDKISEEDYKELKVKVNS